MHTGLELNNCHSSDSLMLAHSTDGCFASINMIVAFGRVVYLCIYQAKNPKKLSVSVNIGLITLFSQLASKSSTGQSVLVYSEYMFMYFGVSGSGRGRGLDGGCVFLWSVAFKMFRALAGFSTLNSLSLNQQASLPYIVGQLNVCKQLRRYEDILKTQQQSYVCSKPKCEPVTECGMTEISASGIVIVELLGLISKANTEIRSI